jgi:hypothetical protein
MTARFLLTIFDQVSSRPIVSKTAAWKAAALATGLGIAIIAYPGRAYTARLLRTRPGGSLS